MDKDGATLFFSFLNKTNSGAYDILLDDILNIIFGPLIGQEIDACEFGTVLTMFACAVDDMSDLIHLKPFDILFRANVYLGEYFVGHEDAVAYFGGGGKQLVGVGLDGLGRLLLGGLHLRWRDICNWL